MCCKTLEAVFFQQFLHAALADGTGAHLRPHIMLHDVEANVGENKVPHVFSKFAALIDLDRRNPQAFLPDLGGIRVVAAGHRAADVGLVALCGRPCDQLAFKEDRLEDGDVVVLVAHGEDVVVKYHVAVINIAVEIFNDVLADRRQGE